MENQNKEFPFPQADDFSKIVLLVNVDDEDKLKDKNKLGKYLGDIVDRQVAYYLSACQYLGIVDKNKEFTNLGKKIREYDAMRQLVELAKIIVKDDIIGTVYFYQQMLGIELDKSDVIDIMKEYIEFGSEAMYIRRAQTVTKWIEWILNNSDQ